jgi:hypothetical protein
MVRGRLALIRLDTDWYTSAKISLETFWPRLSRGGVLIIDDYGHYPFPYSLFTRELTHAGGHRR